MLLPEIVRSLQEQGYEAIGARELGLAGQPDAVVWATAQKRRRVVVTANYPHFKLLTRLSKKRHPKYIFKHKDKTYTYTDATSFAMMERLEIRKAFAFDRHFVQYGFQTLPAAFHHGKARS